MKIELDRDEVRAALEQHVAESLGGSWVCTNADYELPYRVVFEKDTPERRAEEARKAQALAKYKAEQEAATPTKMEDAAAA